MAVASSDVWEAMSTARTIRRFSNEPVDDAPCDRVAKGKHGPVRRRGLAEFVNLDRWGEPPTAFWPLGSLDRRPDHHMGGTVHRYVIHRNRDYYFRQ